MECPIFEKSFKAIKNKDVIKLRCYLSELHDINLKEQGYTLLWVSILTSKRDISTFKTILEYDPDLTISHNNQTPLVYCAEANLSEFVEALLFQGADPNVHDGAGYTPLHYSIFNRNVPIFNILLGFGADPNLKDDEGYDALNYFILGTKSQFASCKDAEFVKLFLDQPITQKHIDLATKFDRVSVVESIVNSQVKLVDIHFGNLLKQT